MAIYRCAACGAVNRFVDGVAPGACSRCRRPLDASGRPQAVDAAALVTALSASPAPVLVDFVGREAPEAELDGVARAYAGELVVLRVDPREEPAAVAAYGIGQTPTRVLFERGAEVCRGGPADGILGWVDRARAERG